MCTYMWHTSTSEEFFCFLMASFKCDIQRSHLRKTPNTADGHVDWLSGRLSKFLILDHDLVQHFTASLLLSGPLANINSTIQPFYHLGCGLFTLDAVLTFATGNHMYSCAIQSSWTLCLCLHKIISTYNDYCIALKFHGSLILQIFNHYFNKILAMWTSSVFTLWLQKRRWTTCQSYVAKSTRDALQR